MTTYQMRLGVLALGLCLAVTLGACGSGGGSSGGGGNGSGGNGGGTTTYPPMTAGPTITGSPVASTTGTITVHVPVDSTAQTVTVNIYPPGNHSTLYGQGFQVTNDTAATIDVPVTLGSGGTSPQTPTSPGDYYPEIEMDLASGKAVYRNDTGTVYTLFKLDTSGNPVSNTDTTYTYPAIHVN